ncbi:hypothetical protein C8J56DRAFT_1050218 [Mycena floridula]|nr:hypothetical protein C8J56DRAFT_1050218 [Mycena floridula]
MPHNDGIDEHNVRVPVPTEQLPSAAFLSPSLRPQRQNVQEIRHREIRYRVITKRRNRLRGDIVEALQILRMAFRQDQVMFAKPPSTIIEEEIAAAESEETKEETDLETELGVELDDDCDANADDTDSED